MDNNCGNLQAIIYEQVSRPDFQKLTISNPHKKQKNIKPNPSDAIHYKKIQMEPKKGASFYFQLTFFYDTKVKHENVSTPQEAAQRIIDILSWGYKQCDIVFPGDYVKLLMTKNLAYKIISSANHTPKNQPATASHNKQKNYIFREGDKVDWLIRLGVMSQEGKIYHDMQKKFRQINKFLELLADINHAIPDHPVIVDFGCGKSYLTFALYDFLVRNQKKPTMIGIDLKKDVVDYCRQVAADLHFDQLTFQTCDIKDFQSPSTRIDLVVTLHACDTATDFALFFAIQQQAQAIMSVPCCQHELFGQVENEIMNPLLKHGVLKDKFASLLTDSLRSNILEIYGYRCQVLEFIDESHTPKNVMLRATKLHNTLSRSKQAEAVKKFLALKDMFSVSPMLWELLDNSVLKMKAGENNWDIEMLE